MISSDEARVWVRQMSLYASVYLHTIQPSPKRCSPHYYPNTLYIGVKGKSVCAFFVWSCKRTPPWRATTTTGGRGGSGKYNNKKNCMSPNDEQRPAINNHRETDWQLNRGRGEPSQLVGGMEGKHKRTHTSERQIKRTHFHFHVKKFRRFFYEQSVIFHNIQRINSYVMGCVEDVKHSIILIQTC